MNRNLTITIVGVVIASIGLVFTLTSSQVTSMPQKSEYELLNEAHRVGCEQSNWQDRYETIEQCIGDSWAMNDIRIDKNQSAGCNQRIADHLEYFINECADNFKELGFESAERCYEVRVALFDPVPCPLN